MNKKYRHVVRFGIQLNLPKPLNNIIGLYFEKFINVFVLTSISKIFGISKSVNTQLTYYNFYLPSICVEYL